MLSDSEDSNSKLRDEILELVTKFGNERNEVEKRLEKYRKECQSQKEAIKEKNHQIQVKILILKTRLVKTSFKDKQLRATKKHRNEGVTD